MRSPQVNNVNVGTGVNYMQMKNVDTDVIEIKIVEGDSLKDSQRIR